MTPDEEANLLARVGKLERIIEEWQRPEPADPLVIGTEVFRQTAKTKKKALQRRA
jgi:hypothetical protein